MPFVLKVEEGQANDVVDDQRRGVPFIPDPPFFGLPSISSMNNCMIEEASKP